MRLFLAFLLCLLSLNTIYLLFNRSFTLGTFIMICACVFLLFTVAFYNSIKKQTETGTGKFIRYLILAGTGCFVLLCAGILSFARSDITYTENVIIIPGCGIKPDNSPTESAIRRLDAGIEYYKNNSDVYIVVCGGISRENCIPEAESMKYYLMENGIPEKNIICEDKSQNTRENFKFAKDLLNGLGVDYSDCALITNSFHILRAKEYAKQEGFDGIKAISVPTPVMVFIPSVAREACAVAAMIVFKY